MRHLVMILAMLVTTVGLAFAGGHAKISVVSVPKSIAPGTSFPLEFTVQYPDGTPIEGLQPMVVVSRGGQKFSHAAKLTREAGRYAAVISLPREGNWTITVDSKYCGNTAVLRDVAARSQRKI